MRQSSEILQELKDIKAQNGIKPGTFINVVEQQYPPPQNLIKINQDAVLDKVQYCKMGVGIIARDWNQSVIATISLNRPLFPSPKLADYSRG